MNKLLQKLADQCRTEYHDGHGNFAEQFDEEKFAELIVKECLSTIENSEGDSDYAMWKIKKDFGVEE